MILHPAVIALLAGSTLTTLMVLYAARWGWKILEGWDLASGSEAQLTLERKTYLVSTMMAYASAFQVLSLFLLIFVADDLHRLFTGAMCAAGTLNVNEFGYPALMLKVLNAVLAGVWLILNRVDNRGFDYPLIRRKYRLLAAMTPLAVMEAHQLWSYFLNLDADVITSCCGSLFSAAEAGVGAGLAALPLRPVQAAFFGTLALTLAAGLNFIARGRGLKAFALCGIAALPVSAAALIAFIGPYYYELPTHHCPFCILQREYRHVGYPLYAAILAGGTACAGAWATRALRSVPSLAAVIPGTHRALAVTAVAAYGALAALVIWRMAATDFSLTGY
jgi:hypothetical protein